MSTEQYGRIFASTFTGSMVGHGPLVFAVWGYVIAHGFGGLVDLHPAVIAATIGQTTPSDVEQVLDFLCSPDLDSRSPDEEGRRLVRVRGVTYRIVTHGRHSTRGNTAAARTLGAARKQAQRERVVLPSNDIATLEPDNCPSSSVTRISSTVVSSDLISSDQSSDPDPTRAREPEVAADPPPSPEKPNPEDRRALDETRSTALHEIPDDWVTPEVVYTRASEIGLPRERVDARVAKLREGPIGGTRGIFRRQLTKHILGLLPQWKAWDDNDAAKARGRPGLAKARGSGDAFTRQVDRVRMLREQEAAEERLVEAGP